MPPHEAGGAVAHAVAPRGNRLVPEVSPHVVGHRLDRRVPLAGVLLQRLGDDGVEIAAQHAAEACGRGPAASRVRAGRVGVERGVLDHVGQPRRIFLDDGANQRGGGAHGASRGMAPAEQHVEQDAERVDVGGCRHRCADELLRGGILRRECAAHLARQCLGLGTARGIPLGGRIGQLRDAEVEQLHLAVDAHQDVGRLDVAVDDEVGVGVRHAVEDIEEQAQPGLDRERVLVRVAIDGQAVDQLDDQVGLAGRRDAGIHQMGDARVLQPREDRAFAAEPLLAGAADQREIQQLDGGTALEAPIAPLGEPDAARSAFAEWLEEAVGANDLARERRRRCQARVERDAVEEVLVVGDGLAVEHRAELCRQARVAFADRRQPGLPRLGRDVERRVEVRAQRPPAIRGERRHGPRASMARGATRHGAGTAGPSPSRAGWCVRRRPAWPRSRRTRTRRRTSAR